MDLIGAADRGEEDSASGSRVVVVAGFGYGSFGQSVCGDVCSEERTVAAGGAAMSGFSESEGDIADAIDQADGQAHIDGDQEAVIHDQTESGDGGSAESTSKVDPQTSAWTKRSVAVGLEMRMPLHSTVPMALAGSFITQDWMFVLWLYIVNFGELFWTNEVYGVNKYGTNCVDLESIMSEFQHLKS
ncbi:hypothetical protein D1007_26856 [Hordeum vulgare]|nr:hypothetical protein D1007_26856 [Hordeum vulgare]